MQAHNLGKGGATGEDLPTSLMDKRKRKSKVYCTKAYFDFICFVESTYLANLTLKMMRAYADGDIVDKIKRSLLSSDVAIEKFTTLFDNERCQSFTDADKQEVMKYMMERYANMRGTYFVKHLKDNGNGNLVNKMAAIQKATRTKVASAVVCAKAVEDAKEVTLWKDAGDSVFDFKDKEVARNTDGGNTA